MDFIIKLISMKLAISVILIASISIILLIPIAMDMYQDFLNAVLP